MARYTPCPLTLTGDRTRGGSHWHWPCIGTVAALVGLVRRIPISSVLIEVGVGYLLARSLGKDTTVWRVISARQGGVL